jgi:hypothetical protein
VAMYAIDAAVTCLIPWMRALPERVAFGSLSTELGDVNTCLNAWRHDMSAFQRLKRLQYTGKRRVLTLTKSGLLHKPFQGSSGS